MDYIMSLILQSSGGGQITIQEPATASNFTATMPAATGTVMVSGNQPAFRAFKSASTQSPTSNVATKVTFDVETFDTNNNFASSRFTPTVAGYYQINAVVDCGSSSIGQALVYIYKNGSVNSLAGSYVIPAATEIGPCISDIVYCNGTTDYIEIYAQITGSTVIIYNGSPYTYVSGVLVRSA
jgi:hypothetical protein